MRVLLLSAYAAHSHVQWQRSLQVLFPEWHWDVLSLPPRHFSWRVRGNPLFWTVARREVLERDHDLLLATSMVDLATLKGLVPALAHVPAVLYFHENQFDYPRRPQQHSLLEAQMVSLYGALAADRVVFNSRYNRDSFLEGCGALLAKLPDFVPPGVVASIRQKAAVLPVPLEVPQDVGGTAHWPGLEGDWPQRPLRLLWSGRFEHDKAGDRLLGLLRALEDEGPDYELAVTGQRFRHSPPAFDEIECAFSHRLVQFGYLESRRAYHALLRGADIVVSTALHEFQGLAVLEAVAAGCLPAVPARQAYPEIYPAAFRYASHPGDPAAEALAAAALIRRLAADLAEGRAQAPDVSAYGPAALRPKYRAELQGAAAMAG
jgi:glycosyltransferase involved in cell wall biosynthesis